MLIGVAFRAHRCSADPGCMRLDEPARAFSLRSPPENANSQICARPKPSDRRHVGVISNSEITSEFKRRTHPRDAKEILVRVCVPEHCAKRPSQLLAHHLDSLAFAVP